MVHVMVHIVYLWPLILSTDTCNNFSKTPVFGHSLFSKKSFGSKSRVWRICPLAFLGLMRICPAWLLLLSTPFPPLLLSPVFVSTISPSHGSIFEVLRRKFYARNNIIELNLVNGPFTICGPQSVLLQLVQKRLVATRVLRVWVWIPISYPVTACLIKKESKNICISQLRHLQKLLLR